MQLKVTVDKTKGIVVSPAAASADAGLHLTGEVGGTTDATTLEGTPGVVPASVTGASAAAALALTIGSRFGRVVLAPLGTGADDMPRDAAVRAACSGLYPVGRNPGTWYSGTATFVVDQDSRSPIDENGRIDSDDLLVLQFNSPGVKAANTLKGSRGESIYFSRASTATLIVNGTEVSAAANEARVDEDGLLIEPACTQLLSHADDMTDVIWVTGTIVTPVIAATDPLGGSTAWRFEETTDAGAHDVYHLATIPASASTISVYAKSLGGRQYLRIGSNGLAETAFFDLLAGTVVSVSSGERAEIESVGDGWYRCSLEMAAGTALISFAARSAANNANYIGESGKGVILWRPQAEANEYATSWTATSRAAETCLVNAPASNGEWCIEVTATPCGPAWIRGSHHTMVAIGTASSANSIEGYISSGYPVTNVYDSAGDARSVLSVAATTCLGQQRFAFSSMGLGRPAVFSNGNQSLAAASGAGTGIYSPLAVKTLYLGSTSSLTPTGGFKFREVRVRKSPVPAHRAAGVDGYGKPFSRGYVARSHCIAALGDSITAGDYDVSITTPYIVGACTTLGTTYQPHNYGCSSNGSLQALDRFRRDIKGRGYAKMVLMIGINDVSMRIPANTTIAHLGAILAEASVDGIAVYPVTLLPNALAVGDIRRDNLDLINAFLRSYAAAHSLHLVEANTDFDDGTGRMKAAWDIDGGSLHPNQAGQTELASLVATALAL